MSHPSKTLPPSFRPWRFSFLLISAAGLTAALPLTAAEQQQRSTADELTELREQAPMLGYLEARRGLEEPQELLGGPVAVEIKQNRGGVHVALPDHRRIDGRVFGTPERPRHYGGSPLVTGLPPMLRETKDGAYTRVSKPSPFGDKHLVMPRGRLSLEARDVTSTDAAWSRDTVSLEARWEGEDGATYRVTCDRVVPHGVEYPVFGGVVTNQLIHGVTGIGSPLMPTEFAYLAFWGIGDVFKDGDKIDADRVVHGMLTEYVRTEDYALAFDHEVVPERKHFHLLVAPVTPQDGHFAAKPVKTGMTLPNGKELPFWHVMFANLEIESSRPDGS